jgi:hypothetical protein
MRGAHLSPAHGHRSFTDGRARAGRANVSCFLRRATYVATAGLTRSSDATLIDVADRGLYPATTRGDNRVGEEASRCRD